MRDLEVLLVSAETCAFRKAAKRMGVEQSAVSRRVRKLEDLIGVSLFERITNGVFLTATGRDFVNAADCVMRDLKLAVAQAQTAAIATNGTLKIGSNLSFSTGAERRLIQQYIMKHPNVELQFVESERHNLLKMLNHRTLDVLLVSCAPVQENGDGFVFHAEPAYLAVQSETHLAEAEVLAWHDVLDAFFLVSERDAGPDVLNHLVSHLSIYGNGVSFSAHHVGRECLMNLVGLGVGVTVVGEHATGVQYPNVTFVRLGSEVDLIPFSISWHPENDNPAMRRFISLARVEAKRNGVLF